MCSYDKMMMKVLLRLSHETDFLEEDFPNRWEIGKEIYLYETKDPNISASSSSNKNVEENLQSLMDNGSDLPTSLSIPIGEDPQVELRKSKRESIIHHRFEIERGALMIAP